MTPRVLNRVVLKFYTNGGDVVRLSIPRARLDKTRDGAIQSMEALLDTDAIITTAGIPRTIRSAEILQTERTLII